VNIYPTTSLVNCLTCTKGEQCQSYPPDAAHAVPATS